MSGSRVRQIEDPKHYYLVENGNGGKLTSLMTALENLQQYFPSDYAKDLPFPEGFSFPPSFEYSVNVGQMSAIASGKNSGKVY